MQAFFTHKAAYNHDAPKSTAQAPLPPACLMFARTQNMSGSVHPVFEECAAIKKLSRQSASLAKVLSLGKACMQQGRIAFLITTQKEQALSMA
ncbi:MAG: hypothetical protein KA972_02560 [Brachymonas sp.]|nr:hypothetical protein [Brachymonas sp.]